MPYSLHQNSITKNLGNNTNSALNKGNLRTLKGNVKDSFLELFETETIKCLWFGSLLSS